MQTFSFSFFFFQLRLTLHFNNALQVGLLPGTKKKEKEKAKVRLFGF